MRRFLNIVALFALPLVAGWFVLEAFYRSVPTNYSEKHRQSRLHRDAEVLILGNSHTFYGLDPDHFKKPAFSLANISQSLCFDELLFEKHVDQFKHLKYVVLNVEFSSLSQQDNTSEDRWRKYFYAAQMDVEVPFIRPYDPRKYSLALTQRAGTTIGYLRDYNRRGTLVNCTPKGWGNDYRYESRYTDLAYMAPFTVKKHEDGSVDFANNTNRLKRIIEACKTRGIRVLIVTMPVSRHYARGVDRAKLQKIFSVCQSLESEHDNCRYANLFFDGRFTDDDFFDPDHLNDRGAAKCSAIVSGLML